MRERGNANCNATLIVAGFFVRQKNSEMAPFAPFSLPFLDCTCTLPPCRSAISLQTHSPSPVPTSFLVVKKGSKIRFRFSGAIPGPSSSIFSRIESPSASFTGDASIFNVPLTGTASMALEMMLDTSCCISPARPVIAGQSSRAS